MQVLKLKATEIQSGDFICERYGGDGIAGEWRAMGVVQSIKITADGEHKLRCCIEVDAYPRNTAWAVEGIEFLVIRESE